MKNNLLLTFIIFISSISNAEVKRILFIGNSYTYVNDLPNTLVNIALSMGDTIVVDNSTPGGYTFNSHSTDVNTQNKIKLGNWDYIVLQEQSQIPSFDPSQVATDCYPYAKKLCDTIKKYNPCGEILFYMTWGRKNGDASNCASYPPICTYAGMQQRLRDSYLEMCDTNNATCSPVGAVWRNYRASYPLVELYNADESHPSVNGTYLAACTFYSTIYHKSTIGATFVLGGVNSNDATTIQTVSSNTVLDSIELWQHAGRIPIAKYTYLTNGMTVNFMNQSLRSNLYSWNFGDGSALNFTSSPSHAYATSGTYTVSLKAQYDSCLEDLFLDTITVSQSPTLIDNHELKQSIELLSNHNTIQIIGYNDPFILKMYSMDGKLVLNTNNCNKTTINTILANGLYLYQLFTIDSKLLKSGKISIDG
jgi:PKD repeat protein